MEKLTLSARLRSDTGKGAAKRLRREGFLPAVLYGGKIQEAISLTVNDHEVRDVLKQHAGKNVLINLNVDKKGQKEYLVLLQEMQTHPYKDLIRHLDFLQVSLDQKIKVAVALNFQGEPVGKATLETHLRQLEVECLPHQIPCNRCQRHGNRPVYIHWRSVHTGRSHSAGRCRADSSGSGGKGGVDSRRKSC